MTIAANKTNSESQSSDHPAHHNEMATAINDLVADVVELAEVPGLILQIASNAGTGFSNTTAETTLWSGTKYDIVENTLAVGDIIEVTGWGTYVNDSGADRTLNIRVKFDAVVLGGTAPAAIPDANGGEYAWRMTCTIRVVAVGPVGILSANMDFGMGFPANLAEDQFHSIRTTASSVVDTTQPFTIDVTGDLDAATSTQTVAASGITITKRNAP